MLVKYIPTAKTTSNPDNKFTAVALVLVNRNYLLQTA